MKDIARDVAENLKRLFPDSPSPLNVFQQTTEGDWDIENIRNGEIGHQKSPNGPNGSRLQPFVRHPVIVLKRIKADDGWIKKNTKIIASMMPGGSIYLEHPVGLVVKTGAIEGIDFEWIKGS